MIITVVGSANMDMVVNAPRLPIIGESIHGGGFFLSPGGKGANQAVACAKMGAQTYIAGRVGNDIFGGALRDSLNSHGVNTKYLKTSDTATGVAMITIVDGNNAIVLDAGSNMTLSPESVHEFEGLLLESSAVLLQLEIPVETIKKVIDLCKGKTLVFFDPAPVVKIDLSMLDGVDFFIPNEHEAPFYNSIPVHNIEGAFSSLDAFRKMGVKYPVITLGENGAV